MTQVITVINARSAPATAAIMAIKRVFALIQQKQPAEYLEQRDQKRHYEQEYRIKLRFVRSRFYCGEQILIFKAHSGAHIGRNVYGKRAAAQKQYRTQQYRTAHNEFAHGFAAVFHFGRNDPANDQSDQRQNKPEKRPKVKVEIPCIGHVVARNGALFLEHAQYCERRISATLEYQLPAVIVVALGVLAYIGRKPHCGRETKEHEHKRDRDTRNERYYAKYLAELFHFLQLFLRFHARLLMLRVWRTLYCNFHRA